MNKSKIFKGIVAVGLSALVVGAIVYRRRAIRNMWDGRSCGCGCGYDDDGDGNPCHMTCAGMADEDDFDDEVMDGE